MLDEEILVEAELSREGWDNPVAELNAIIRRAEHRTGVGKDFATQALNGFFDAQCSGIAVPERWEWSGTRLEGRFDRDVRSAVVEWARWCGNGIVFAELGSDDIAWADCLAFGVRFTVWGYLDYADMLCIPGLRPGFRP
jgi:hypothetical protein